jgi:hypothetical protein
MRTPAGGRDALTGTPAAFSRMRGSRFVLMKAR